MQLRIRLLERRVEAKRCRKMSKVVKKSRKKRATRNACESGADPKCRALHLFGKNEAKWELQKEDVRKWKRTVTTEAEDERGKRRKRK